MGLTVTVQKGHDFSAGNITRAALNNGATPTIGLTGSVGDGEIADNAIDNANIKSDANIAIDKLALASGKIIIGAANGNASALSATTSFSSVANHTEGNSGLLTDVGDRFEVLKTNTLAVPETDRLAGKQYLNGDSSLSIHTVVTAGVNVNNLRIKHVDNSVHGNHISKANALDDASIGKNSAGKLEVKDGGIHHQKLYPYKNAAGTQMPGFLVYGASGNPTVLEANASSSIPVTVSASATPVSRVYRKFLNVGKMDHNISGGSNQQGAGWLRASHGIGTGSTVPSQVDIILECAVASTVARPHGYTIGDRIYVGGNGDLANDGFTVHADGEYVTVVISGVDHIEIPKKYGGASPANDTHSGSEYGYVEWTVANQVANSAYAAFNIILVVSE